MYRPGFKRIIAVKLYHQSQTPVNNEWLTNVSNANPLEESAKTTAGDFRVADTIAVSTTTVGYGPDVHPIAKLHRGTDGFVTFHHIDDDRFDNLYAVPAAELEQMFPQFIEHLQQDSYFSINAFKYPAYRSSGYHPDLRQPRRKSSNLRWLTACFVDLDVYNLGLDVGQTIGLVVQQQDAGTIPPASMIVRSGRGVWLLWMLHDPKNPGQPSPAYWDKRSLYARVQNAIGKQMADMGADMGALDAARITRVPGSVNSKSGDRVGYWIQRNQDGQPFTYTLTELADKFGAKTPATAREAVDLVNADDREQKEAKHRGWIALRNIRLKLFTALRVYRGGFREGHRNHAALLYANLLAQRGMPEDEIRRLVVQLGSECKPPLAAAECSNAIKNCRTIRKITNQKISDWLQITPKEAEHLTTVIDSGRPWGPASRYLDHPPPAPDEKPPNRNERMRQRRDVVRRIVGGRQPGDVPTYEQISDHLSRRYDIDASPATVMADFYELGITTPRQRKRP